MKVRLHKLTDEAREMVRTGSYDEAIAICRYILKQHPKYIEAYRVLAEACLERGDYNEASDLFKRVLSAAPHNFIAYVGLGIIYEDDGLTDEAIWQFERAFELSPANSEIRQMLKRLYEERDGVEPARLKLNRAALSHLYIKGGLYPEAIAELEEVLTQHPERIDLQLALAEAYWHADNRRQAAEVCQDILNQMPNCLKANLLLGEIWINSGLEEEGETLLRRAKNMDPEGTVAAQVLGERAPLPAEEIWIERPEELEAEIAALEAAEQAQALLAAPAEEILEEGLEIEAEQAPEAESLVGPLATEETAGIAEEAPEAAEEPIAVEEEGPAPEERISPERSVVPLPGEPLAEEFEAVPAVDEAAIEEESLISVEPEETPLAEAVPAEEEEAVAWKEEPEAIPADEAVLEQSGASEERETTEDEGSPVIEALELEFGALPDLDLGEVSEEEREALMASIPSESASTEEILAWLEEQKQKAIPIEPTSEITEEIEIQEEENVEALDLETKPAEAAEEEGESPVIEALEAEFGSLPALDLGELSDEQRAELEASMPPETASPEEIMAWLRQQGTLMDLVSLPEMPEISEEAEEKPEWLSEFEHTWEEMPETPDLEESEAQVLNLEQAQIQALEAPIVRDQEPLTLEEGEIEIESQAPVESLQATQAGLPSEQPQAGKPTQLEQAEMSALEAPVKREGEPLVAEEGEIEIESEADVESLQAAKPELASELPESIGAELEREQEGLVGTAEPTELQEAEVSGLKASVRREGEPLTGQDGEIEIEVETEIGSLQAAQAPPPGQALAEEVAEAAEETIQEPMPEVEEMSPEAVTTIEEAEEPAVPEPIEAVEPEPEEAAPPEAVTEIEQVAAPELEPEVTPVSDMETYMAALESDPQDHPTRLALARARVETEDWELATQEYETLARSAPDLLDGVIADLEEITSTRPDLLGLQQVLGDAYMEAGRLQDALDKYNWLLTRM